MELRMYLEILRRRRLLIVAVTVIVAGVAGITSSLKTRRYTATAQVMLRPGDPTEELNPEKAARSYGDANRYLDGQINIIRSENVAKAAVEELGGGNAATLLGGVSARQAGTTDIIAIAYTDPDPVLASRVANAFAQAYIENRRSTSVAGLERASREVDAKLIEAEQRLANLDQEIAGKAPLPTTTTATATTTTTTTKPTPLAAPPTPAAPPAPAAAAAPPPPAPTPPAAPTATTAPPPAAAPEPAPTTATKPSRTTTTRTPGPLDGPAPRAVPFRLIVARSPEVAGAAAPAPENLDSLKAARDAAAVQYAGLYSRQQELLITTSLKRGEAELIAAADVPRAPSSPHPKRDLALGTVVGLMLGLGFAFLRDQLDDRLHSREEAEEATHLPVLGELPLDAEGAKRPAQVAAHERPKGGLAEATRGLRTSLTFLGVDEPVRRLLVTSPGQGDGKSFVAANLAASYAQAGFRTALVSADLRRPRLESLFPGIAPGPGLSEIVAGLTAEAPSTNGHGKAGVGDAMVAVALRPTHIDGLLLLPTGKLPPNPAELLASKRTTAVLESLSRQVDVVIIDSPPILAVTDAAVLAPNSDGVILVAAPWRTRRGALARTAAMLSETGARLVGVVLNQVEGKRESYSYSYYGAYSRAYTAAPERRSRVPWRRHNGHYGNGNGATAESEAWVEVSAE